MTETPKNTDRRRFIVGLGAVVVILYAGVRSDWVRRLLPDKPLPFQKVDAPAGYRKLSGGAITGGFDPLVGLGEDKPEALLLAEQEVTEDLCSSLFAQNPAQSGQVPVAYFFDYQCPICRRLTPRLRVLDGVSISWHDLATLGESSQMAAKASIAARNQGAYDQFHDRLMRAKFEATEGYVSLLAESVGIDAERLITDLNSPAVAREMWRSRALANLFGMLGTPGLVVGRTVVIGDITTPDLEQLVALELSDPGQCV